MITLTIGEIATIVGGHLLDPERDANHRATGVTIDSRQTRPGDVFVPVVAERDGHAFIADACANGAVAFFCAKDHPIIQSPQCPAGAILVEDPVAALTALGTWHRDTVNPTVVAVTGSNGKTTTKDFIRAALAPCGEVVATHGSFNNELGMPLTLCALTETTKVLVCEVGARGIGHIAQAMPMLRPDIGVVTTIGAAHIGEFGSEDAISQAKGELVEALPEDGLAILNADNAACAALAGRTTAPVRTVGTSPTADVHPDAIHVDAQGVVTLTLGDHHVRSPLPGVHQPTNLLAAIAVADALGVPRADSLPALSQATVSPMRMAMTTVGNVTIMNDAYNANEGSMIAALDTLAAVQCTQRIAVLGYVHELGDDDGAILGRIACHSADVGIDLVIGVNARGLYQAARPDVQEVAAIPDALALIQAHLRPDEPSAILVKGSRAEGLERLVTVLTTHLEQAA